MQRYLNKNELKDYLGVSLGTINNKLNELPHIKWGDNRNSRVLFPVEEIEKYFDITENTRNVNLLSKETKSQKHFVQIFANKRLSKT